MEIIQTELRLKDIEWVEKAIDNMKKTTRSLNSTSLADKAKKEELVRIIVLFCSLLRHLTPYLQATVEKVYKVLTVDSKDVRKAEWTNKEVSHGFDLMERMKKSTARITQLFEKGVTPLQLCEIYLFILILQSLSFVAVTDDLFLYR